MRVLHVCVFIIKLSEAQFQKLRLFEIFYEIHLKLNHRY